MIWESCGWKSLCWKFYYFLKETRQWRARGRHQCIQTRILSIHWGDGHRHTLESMCSVVSLSLYPNIPVAHALVGSSREDEGLLCPFCHCCNCRLKPDFVFVSTFWDLVEVCFWQRESSLSTSLKSLVHTEGDATCISVPPAIQTQTVKTVGSTRHSQ